MDARDDSQQFCIAVQGSVDSAWLAWLDEVEVQTTDGITRLRVRVADQAMLRGLLSQLWDLNLTVLSVNPA